jgi:YHS domain-containing protein
MKSTSGKIRLVLMSLLFALVQLAQLSQTAHAQSPIYGAKDGPALEGYDTVAYFIDTKPVLGKASLSFEWQGATWHFASSSNRELFIANPEKYAPQYGGHCAFGMSNDSYASGDPHRWKMENGKLYLNTNKFAHWLWERDIPEKVKSADGYWPEKKQALLLVKKE